MSDNVGLSRQPFDGSSEFSSYRSEEEVKAIRSVRAEGFTRAETSQSFGDPTGKAFNLFIKDIEQNGQLYPVLVYGNKILDGFKRYKACQTLKIPVLICELFDPDEVPSNDELTRLTLSSQFSRESFTKIQKAAHIREMFDAVICRGRPEKESGTDSFLRTIAGEYDVSMTYLKLVGRAKREKPELFKRIKAGEVSYNEVEAAFPAGSGRKAKSKTSPVEMTPPIVESTLGIEMNPPEIELTNGDVKSDWIEPKEEEFDRAEDETDVEEEPDNDEDEKDEEEPEEDEPDIVVEVDQDLLAYIVEYVKMAEVSRVEVGRKLLAVSFHLITEGFSREEKEEFKLILLDSAEELFENFALT